MKRIGQELQRLLRDEQGLSTIEYGILASLIALAAMQALGGLGGENAKSFDAAGDKLAEQRTQQTNNDTQSNPDEPAVAGDAPLDPNANNSTPDEPPVAAAMAPPE